MKLILLSKEVKCRKGGNNYPVSKILIGVPYNNIVGSAEFVLISKLTILLLSKYKTCISVQIEIGGFKYNSIWQMETEIRKCMVKKSIYVVIFCSVHSFLKIIIPFTKNLFEIFIKRIIYLNTNTCFKLMT